MSMAERTTVSVMKTHGKGMGSIPPQGEFWMPFDGEPRPPKRVIHLAPESVAPMVRLAHRMTGPLASQRRIIYDYEWVYVTEGGGQVFFEDQVHPYRAGSLFLIPPFRVHRFVPGTREGGHLAIHFDWAPGVPKGNRVDRKPYAIHVEDQALGFLALPAGPKGRDDEAVETVVRHFGKPGARRSLDSRAAMLHLATRVMEEHEPDLPGTQGHHARTRMEQVLAFAEGHLEQKITPAMLAGAAGMSLSHFNRLFRQIRGTSPADAVRSLRIRKARELLALPGTSIREIARRVGFEDALHFSRVFRSIDGLPPTRYREQAMASVPVK